ncbi:MULTISPECIES: histidine phosphatase family protein [unclassified Paenibacillus]|uniref:histidine phosphatase family protein n=1 Tax=unclassified Paenibacillus TaxID=185978 RepID=UPI0009A640AC|nr:MULTISPECIES: histidine phosphatase family protein [unclassified Paenibacillus]SLK13259.1 Broad specificity phosphatase PhoE [Paenibacillus sp. RU5A]SOC72960.1 Broad specificity phosphatase PhoE [Paenibacillus sp. RU26A]SOC75217.1 Broad specificity phosphatase PhoE [Paenibacillus sp. RU5M]
MDITFIRHGHAEHLLHYPHQLNQLHPGLTEQGKRQATELRKQIKFLPEDIVLVSPTKRTIETAFLLTSSDKLTVCPLVGPRMFPQNPEFPVLRCDQIYSKDELNAQYTGLRILDFELDCWLDGINRTEEHLFEAYAGQLIQWCREQSGRTFIISHDGTITNYRAFLGEQGLTRSDFLGEAGHYTIRDL